jgi:hypothetical protein
MKQFRVTKYDPKHRDARGAYTQEEWTSYSDIGKSVTKEEYEKVETAYIETALKFLTEQGIAELKITCLERHGDSREANRSLSDGTTIKTDFLVPVLRGILREHYWAKLESKNAFLHFGWDYYMYIGVPDVPQQAPEYAARNGLFVEEFESPYRGEL